jgi:DNA processing protein
MLEASWLVILQAAEAASVGWVAAFRYFGDPCALLAAAPARLERFGIDRAAARKLHNPDSALLATWRSWLSERGHSLVPMGSAAFPARLAQIHAPPLALWTDGPDVELLQCPQLAIVGSRQPTAGGVHIARELAAELSARGLTVTSGLAAGIDAAGHAGALDGVAGTVAVLGSGLDRVYPRCNSRLAERIRARGLIVSEYAPGTPARGFHFPRRNRIIAGLTLGTLVVEASRRSGSLITARLALEAGREVFAIPGSIRNPLSRGCHQLLRRGAKLVEDVDDIFCELAPMIELPACIRAQSRAREEDSGRAKFLNLLGFEPFSASELVARAGLTAAEVSSMLLLLEMEGVVEALPGGRYCRLVKRA